MNNHKYSTQPQSYTVPLHSSPQIRSNRIQQQLDDLHLVIESSTPIKHKNTTINYVSPTRGSNYSQQETDYLIEIQQDDGSNIDVTLKLSREYQSPQRRSPQLHNPQHESQNSYTENKNLNDRYNRPTKYRQNHREQKQYEDRKYRTNNDIEYDEMKNNIKISYNDNSNNGSVSKSIRTTQIEVPQQEQNPSYADQLKSMRTQTPKGEHRPTAKQQCIHPNYHKNKNEDSSMELDISNSFSMIKQPNGQTYHNFQTKYKNTQVQNGPISYTFGHEYTNELNNGNNINVNDYSQINLNRNNTSQKKQMKIQRSQKTFGSISNNNGNIRNNPLNQNPTINANVYMNESMSSHGNRESNKQKQKQRQRQRQRQRQKDRRIKNNDLVEDHEKQYWSQSRKPNQGQHMADYYSVNRYQDQQSPTFNRIQLFNKQRNSPKSSINSNKYQNQQLNMQETLKKQRQQKYRQNEQVSIPNKTNYNTKTQFDKTNSNNSNNSDRNYYSSNSYKNQGNNSQLRASIKGNLTQKNSEKNANQGATKSDISYFNKQVGREIVNGKFGKKQKYQSIKIEQEAEKKSVIEENRNKNINPMNYSSYKQSRSSKNHSQSIKNPTLNQQYGANNLNSSIKSDNAIKNENNSHTKSPNVFEYQVEEPINVQSKPNIYNTPPAHKNQDAYRSFSNQYNVNKQMRTYQHSNQQTNKKYQQQKQYESEREMATPKSFEPYTEIKQANTARQTNKNWPPSMKDIPKTNTNTNSTNKQSNKKQRESSNSKSKIIKLRSFQEKSNLKRISNSPIVVPMKRIPKYQTQTNQKTNQETKRVKISLNTTDHKATKQRQRQLDVFAINKQKYLNKLRREQQSRSGSRPNRLKSNNSTLSRNSRNELSPECEQVTNRLHNSRINKQPCAKYIEYKQSMNRLRMRQTLGEYTFIRRYMSDDEIFEVLGELEQTGVPEKKWPVKLIDVVYNKLRRMKAF